MCSIMGYCDARVRLSVFEKGFRETISRGPDESSIVNTGNGLLGFHRLAIMGLTHDGMQPFQLDDSWIVCNGEIYGFEKIKSELSAKYQFKSESDCEILLPMYREYGVDMFRMLDAEFALILYDGRTNEYVAARDPIGIRPLYYGYDNHGVIVFASEAKNLTSICSNIHPAACPEEDTLTHRSGTVPPMKSIPMPISYTFVLCARQQSQQQAL